ncbi:MAG: DUF2470 domain-containing protein [Nitriliruptoraceae bacterium]
MPPEHDQTLPDGRFPDHVVAAVVQHMNDDHADDTAVIVRAFGGLPRVDVAEVTDVDTTGLTVAAQVGEETRTIRVAFAQPVTARLGLREEVTRLYHAACAELGGSTPTGQAPP